MTKVGSQKCFRDSVAAPGNRASRSRKRLLASVVHAVLLGSGCATAPLPGSPMSLTSTVAAAPAPQVQGTEPVPRAQKPESAGDVQPASDSSTEPAKPIQGQVTCRVRATVNGLAILDDELKQAAYGELAIANQQAEPERSARLKEIIRRELEKLIERELIMAEAQSAMEKKSQAWKKLQEYADKEFEKNMRTYKQRLAAQGVPCESEEQLKEVLSRQGLTVDGLKRQIERNFMAMEYMRHMIYPLVERIGHKEIQDYYDQHPGEFQLEDRVHWQDIFIDAGKHPNREAARRFAEEIARAARMGDSFARLCEMYDNGDSVCRKGDGYGAKRGEIRPVEAEPCLFEMHEGDIGPILELSTGFHVFRLVERQYPGMQPFDEKTQSLIKKKLTAVIMDREYKRTVDELKRRAVIQVLDNDL